VLADLVLLEDAEGLAGEVGAVNVVRVEDITQVLAGKAVEAAVIGVQLRTQDGPARLRPAERLARCNPCPWRTVGGPRP
jgi:hypothetical protein